MKGAWTIERAPQKVWVLDIAGIRSAIFGNSANVLSRESWECEAWESIVNGYFSLQNEVLFDGFWTELISAQTPLLALGAPFFDPRPLASYIKKKSSCCVSESWAYWRRLRRSGEAWSIMNTYSGSYTLLILLRQVLP
jgi:hypothetical protein